MRRCLLFLFLASMALAQMKVVNPGFEDGDLAGVPNGWHIPKVATDAGFTAKLVDQGCRTGARCAMITGAANAPENMFGNLIQTLPAAGYTLHHIRLRAAIRVEGRQTRAQMWLRLDRADHSMAFLENMGNRPVVSADWNTYDIETDVDEDVSQLVFGIM